MLLLLVGPSGVGKSTLGAYAAQNIQGCYFYDLDGLVAKRYGLDSAAAVASHMSWEGFFDACKREVDNLEENLKSRNGTHIIAVGAGTFMSSRALAWLSSYETVTIIGEPEEVIMRNPLGPARKLDEYKKTEYSDFRMQIYEQSKHKIVVNGLTKEQAQKTFLQYVMKSLYEG